MARAYKETRVELRPFSPNTVVNIQVPAQDGVQRRARFSIAPGISEDETPIAKDEDDFSKRYLATQSSVYFRRRRAYPRTFLWRVVDDSKVLEIQCADLTKSGTERHEYNNTLRLEFQDAIVPSGVAFADLEDHEVLTVFVVTASSQLYTLTLRPEFFRRTASIDENVSDWCKSCRPAPLAFSHPHRLHANGPLELFISLDNGSLLQLTRRSGDDGSQWSLLTFDERTWGSSIRGLVRWHAQPSIKYDGRNLDTSTVNAMTTTSDQTYVFAVCLNHTLKIWNLATKKLVASKDLLDRHIEEPEGSTYFLNPSESSFIRVFNAERAMDGGYRYFVVTYSPFEDGRFKFWAIKGGLTTPLVIEDLFPDATLRPVDPDPSGNVFWSIADFQVKSAEEGKHMELWVLWRNSSVYQLYTLHFDFQTLVTNWSTNWVKTALEVRRQDPPPPIVPSDVVDPTEKWLKYLLQPGRFQPEVLQTALIVYQEALKPLSSASLFKRNLSLEERLCSTVTATVSLRKYAEDDMDFTRYNTDVDSKWRQFWQIANDLNQRRLVPLSLAYDLYNDMLWLLLSDSCAVIRECTPTELLLHNSSAELGDNMATIADRWTHRNVRSEVGEQFDQASSLMHIAADFRRNFSFELSAACRAALDAEIFSEPSTSVPDRLEEFQMRCDFGSHVSDGVFDSLCDSLSAKLGTCNISTEVFFAIMDTLPPAFPGKDSELRQTHFGIKVTVNGAQETILLTRQILFDLLILVTFLSSELKGDELSELDVEDLFESLISNLKEYEMMHWLCSNVRKCPERFSSSVSDQSAATFSLKESGWKDCHERIATIFEDIFAIPIKPRPAVGLPQSYAVTLGIRDVLSWVTRQGEVVYPNVLVYIQCNLLAHNNIDLAYDFLRFQPTTPWATYAKGRLFVALSDYDTAALYFQKAAYLLSCGRALGDLHEMSSTLLDIVSVDSFNNGLPKYFQHILSIFEQARSFTHVADFANLALQALEVEKRDEQDPEYVVSRTDLLSRLFHASLKTCQFDQAYSALSRYQDLALQRSALSSLVSSVVAASGPGTAGLRQLLHFPTSLIPNIRSHVDETLANLAKKQSSFSSFTVPSVNNNNPDYHRILQAYRIARNDLRGAAEAAYQNVQRLQAARERPSHALLLKRRENDTAAKPPVDEDDLESKEVRHELLALINLLACVEKSEAYILVEKEEGAKTQSTTNRQQPSRRRSARPEANDDDDGNVFMDDTERISSPSPSESAARRRRRSSSGFGGASASGMLKPVARRDSRASAIEGPVHRPTRRVIVTLDHLRREYQAELDRVSRIERGDWEFGVFDAGDLADNDDTMVLS